MSKKLKCRIFGCQMVYRERKIIAKDGGKELGTASGFRCYRCERFEFEKK